MDKMEMQTQEHSYIGVFYRPQEKIKKEQVKLIYITALKTR